MSAALSAMTSRLATGAVAWGERAGLGTRVSGCGVRGVGVGAAGCWGWDGA